MSLVRGRGMPAQDCKGQEAGQNIHYLKCPGQRWQIGSFRWFAVKNSTSTSSPTQMTLIFRDWDSRARQDGACTRTPGVYVRICSAVSWCPTDVNKRLACCESMLLRMSSHFTRS